MYTVVPYTIHLPCHSSTELNKLNTSYCPSWWRICKQKTHAVPYKLWKTEEMNAAMGRLHSYLSVRQLGIDGRSYNRRQADGWCSVTRSGGSS